MDMSVTGGDTGKKPVAKPPQLLQVERELLAGYLHSCERAAAQTGYVSGQHIAASAREAATLRGLLERLG
jgi:hypothetical protein